MLLFWHFSGRFRVDAPICGVCKPAFIRARRFRSLVAWLCIAVAVVLMFWLLGAYLRGYPRPLRKWIMLLAAIVVLAPFFVWELRNPPVFDLTAWPKSVDYEFRDPLYAAEFAHINGSDVR
jgi:hypothetical protein